MKNFSDYRKIKPIATSIAKDEMIFNPNTLEIIKNNIKNNIAPSQFYINGNVFESDMIVDGKNIMNKKNTTKNMETPDLSLPLTDILNVYNIDNYDELLLIIKDLIKNNSPKYTIYRLVNLYTRAFFNDNKNTHNALIKILKIIFPDFNIEDKIYIEFLNNWFKNHNEDDFELNLCGDFKKFLGNKYGTKTK